MKNYFEELVETNKGFIETLKAVILESKKETIINMFLSMEERKAATLDEKLIKLNKDNTFLKIRSTQKSAARSRFDHYILIKNSKDNEYLFHFQTHKDNIELKVISHQFYGNADILSSKFTYSKKYTTFDSSKTKESLRLQGKDTTYDIEELNDIFKLTKDIDFLEDLKLSIKIIGTDIEKEIFINNFNNKNEVNSPTQTLNGVGKRVKS